ncbi:MAG: ATP-dependent RNA helicase RhlE [Flavobacteriales bacterium]|jgi:ATP-dependent RNA helicase RhlE
MSFSSLNLVPELLQAIRASGYQRMTPIQAQAIKPACAGKDLLANAQTGTGKTAAFAIPVLQQMALSPKPTKPGSPRAIILTPTRELAEQLASTIGHYAQFLPLTITAAYGGVKMTGQEAKLKAGVDILIATPGRLLEHIVQCNVNMASVEFAVLDEADRMLDMGFVSDVQSILQLAPKSRQTLLFSATLSGSINELAHKLLHKHLEIRVAKQNTISADVEEIIYPVEERKKIELFLELLEGFNWFQVLVFTSTKAQADQLMISLRQCKIDAAICHGDKSQGSRRRALADFKSAKIQVLISTEVAARGLDIQGLEYVVNYNLPYLAEDYVHRIGRTGRAGAKGHAISFVSREEERTLDTIQRLIGHKIKRIHHSGYVVSNRDSLIKTVENQKRSVRTNKVSQTRINRDSISAENSAKSGAEKASRKRSGNSANKASGERKYNGKLTSGKASPKVKVKAKKKKIKKKR